MTSAADELPVVAKKLNRLLWQLRDSGVINAERWEKFFGDGE
jgi:hypothetical protein